MGCRILVLGGIRSGKSRLAESLAVAQEPVTYVATALNEPTDPAMAVRIARHRARRPATWTTREIPRDLDARLPELTKQSGSVLIDCATLWITNLMLGLGGGSPMEDDEVIEAVDRAVQPVPSSAQVLWVSNEVGMGGIAENALARRFADLQGQVNQQLAAACDTVYLCVAGLSLKLK